MTRAPLRMIAGALLLAVVLAGSAAVAATRWLEATMPPQGVVAEGVLACGTATARGEAARQVARRCAATILARRVRLTHDGAVVVDATLAELGVEVDAEALERRLLAVGREGSLWRRLDEALRARRGQVAVSQPLRLPAEGLVERLSAHKEGIDREPEGARWDFERDEATQHVDGARLDAYAAVQAVARAAAEGDVDLPLPVERLAPRATRQRVTEMDRSERLAQYQTLYAYLGGQAGRAQNIARAAEGIDGLVLMPDEAVSFNELVGPRSVDNGFAPAGEIYRGELRMGIGGGTCQVASTFHAAAFFAGIDVVERSPHSRPSGYIPIGLDATVAYPVVDLVVRNPYDFPIVVRAHSDPPGTLVVELFGRRRPATVDFAAATVGVKPYKRKIREARWLEEGRVIRKQKGIRGVVVERIRTIEYVDGTRRVEKTTDVYPPTNEIYYVAPGTNPAADLPPLPADVAG